MSLPFFRDGVRDAQPIPLRLWSVKLGRPILACVLHDWECLWVHYLHERGRTALHHKSDCPHCKQGKRAQKRAYAAALIMIGVQPGTFSPVRWGNHWVPGVIELPGDAYTGVMIGWPNVFMAERLTKGNGPVRCTATKAHVALPPVTKVWEIEPTICRAFGLVEETMGGER